MNITPSHRVVIIGSGNVGASAAYSVLTQEIAKEIILIDIAEDLLKAQVLDMQDSSDFTQGVKVKVGKYDDLINGDIVVITCGAAQKEGQSRLDLLNINAKIIRSVITEIKNTGKLVYILMVTNPVDILTYIAIKESGLPEGLVFGSGTFLDSARLRFAIAQELQVSTSNVHAYIMGEHGDSSFPAIEEATIAGIPLKNFKNVGEHFYEDITLEIRNKAYNIIKGKGSTYYGIGSAVARIIKSIMTDEKRIVPLSVMLKGEYGFNDVAIGVPARISSNGVEIVGEIKLSQKEQEMFNNSVKVIKENLQNIL